MSEGKRFIDELRSAVDEVVGTLEELMVLPKEIRERITDRIFTLRPRPIRKRIRKALRTGIIFERE